MAFSAYIFDEMRLGSSLRLTPVSGFEHVETKLKDHLQLNTL